jgi:hypothetical protein
MDNLNVMSQLKRLENRFDHLSGGGNTTHTDEYTLEMTRGLILTRKLIELISSESPDLDLADNLIRQIEAERSKEHGWMELVFFAHKWRNLLVK